MSDALAPASVQGSQKLDPESLVLRGNPGRATRFRRGAIVAIAGAGSTAILAVAWLALKPATLNLIPSNKDGTKIAGALPPDVLAGSPRGYDEIPQLGPPLPGDLGRPILNRQPELASADPSNAIEQKAEQEAEAERQRLATETRSARESGVMLQLAGSARVGLDQSKAASALGTVDSQQAVSVGEGAAFDRQRDPNGQQRKIGFLARGDGSGDINPHSLTPAASPYTISAGSVISASLITGLNSDLPGLVTAQVTENSYDTPTGRILLIPQGTRLIGSYDSVIAFGQKRALVVWQRMILPNGSSIRIDNVPAADLAGHAGLSDRIDRHSWQLLKGIGLSTLLGIGTELSFGSDESDLVEAMRDSAQQNAAKAGDELVKRNLEVQPTLRVRPGWPLRILVHKDIVLMPWRPGVR